MEYYTKILPWENKRRLNRLIEFRKKVIAYFNNTEFRFLEQYLKENEEARKIRVSINMSLDEIYEIILCAGIIPKITYTPPLAVGGLIRDIDLIHNIFHIQMYQLSPNEIIDQLERAIGKYTKNRKKALLRLINPFFYLGLLFAFIANLPFILIGRIGFDRTKVESSVIGRIIKGFFYLITILASLLAIIYYLGYMDSVRELIRSFIGIR
jgi:hypothetical protein